MTLANHPFPIFCPAALQGIKQLTKLISETCPGIIREQELKMLTGRKIAIDASMAIYQFLVSQYMTQCRVSRVLCMCPPLALAVEFTVWLMLYASSALDWRVGARPEQLSPAALVCPHCKLRRVCGCSC